MPLLWWSVSDEPRSRLWIARIILWTVGTMAAGVLAWALPGAARFVVDAPSAFWAMTLAALLADVPLFGVFRRTDLRARSTLSVCFTFAIFVLWGAAPAIVVQAVAGAVTAVGQRSDTRAGLYLVSRLILAAAVAELVVNLIERGPVITSAGLNGGDLIMFVLLATVWLAVNYGLLAVARTTVGGGGLRQPTPELRDDLYIASTSVVFVSPLLTTVPGWWSLLVAAPLAVWNRLWRERLRREEQRSREPVTGLLDQQGIAAGMRTLTAYDLIAPKGPRPFGIILISVESVLTINRTLGRDLYEKVVTLAARRLVDRYSEEHVGRLSGEGIVILMPDLTETDAVAQADAAARVLSDPIDVDDIPFSLDPVAGAALSPRHGRELGTLLAKAELAVSEARRRGQRAVLYVRQAEDVARRRITLIRELRATLLDPARRGAVTVLYQPKVDLATSGLSGVEALVRWNHPEWGQIPTDELIEAIEPSNVMHLLTWHVLKTVVGDLRRWNEQGRAVRAAVNVSVQDLHDPEFADELGQLIRSQGISPTQLTIEITEGMLMADTPRVAAAAAMLVTLGVGLALDDFGTGFASLQQLRQLPLTEVKIDRSYVSGMVDTPADRAIVRSVHQLAQALDVVVVAEGVEDQRTADALTALPGTHGQGYHFGRPMTAEALDDWHTARTSGAG